MKNVNTGVLVLGLSILHIWLGRIESVYSYVLPLVGGLILASHLGSIKDWAKGFMIGTGEKDEFGKEIKRINAFKVVFVGFTLWLYFCSFVDRG